MAALAGERREQRWRQRQRLGDQLRRVGADLGPGCRFRDRGPEYVRESGMKWMGGGAERQRDRALRRPPGTYAQRSPRRRRAAPAAAPGPAHNHECLYKSLKLC